MGKLEEEKLFRMTSTQQMISSCSGGLLTSLLVTPLDVVKIRLQTQQRAAASKKCCFIYCNGLMDHVCTADAKVNAWVNRPGHFNGTLDAFQKIVKYEGAASLWSGLSPTLVMAVPSTIIYFTSYEQLKVFFIDKYRSSTGRDAYPVYLPLLAGGLARVWSVTFINPLELIRTKMQSKRLTYSEMRAACADLYRTQGIRGFWLGYVPTLIRDVPFSAIYWGCYETQKKLFGYQQEQPPHWFSFMGGAVAGSVAGTVTIPFDVIKTLKQIEMGEADFKVAGTQVTTSRDIITKIYRQSGIQGFFAGLTPRLAKIAPACAIMLCSYEYGRTFFTTYNRKKYERERSTDDNYAKGTSLQTIPA